MKLKYLILTGSLVFWTFIHIGFASAQQPDRVVFDFSRMYETVNPSIVKVHADGGTGSGFLVSRDGLIATNHHVVRNTRYLAVQFADGRKVKAEIVVLNPRHDVALIKVNKSVVQNLIPLHLLTPEKDADVKAGKPVVAFGSPLSQTFLMTQGIISKVEDEVLLGDFLIKPGNSGGPLVNLDGDVIGINTFTEAGISGAVHVRLLRETLAREDLRKLVEAEPPLAQLPILQSKRYPTELLKNKVLEEKLDWDAYRFDGGKFVVTVMTPVLVGKVQIQDDLQQAANRYKRRGKKIADPSYHEIDEPFYEWYRNATSLLDYAVTFEVKPDFGATSGSKWAMALAAFGGANGVNNTHLSYEYKAEFQDFKLYRDGKLIEPVTPGRAITENKFTSAQADFIDEAYSGMYVYAPQEFLTGSEFRMDIYDAKEPGKVHKSVRFRADSKLIKQIRSDFAGAEGK